MNRHKINGKLLAGLLAVLFVMVAGLAFTLWEIREDLIERIEIAQAAYPHQGDDAAALIDYIRDDTRDLEDRNRAVWALGRTRDPRGAAALAPYLRQDGCDHSRYLCQKELVKSIERCDPAAAENLPKSNH